MPFNIAIMTLALSTSTDMGKLEFWAAAGAIFGVFLFVRGFQMLRYKRLILNTPSSKIRSASMGLVEVTGMAKGPQVIPAGITGDPCYYYRATAWKLKQNGRNRDWERVADESLYVPFFVEDSTGRMLVNAQGAQLDVHCNFKDEIGTSFFGSSNMVPPNVSRFLLRYGLVGVEGIRLEEYCIKPEYPLFVLGTLGRNSSGQVPQWSPASHVPRSQASHAANLSFLGPTGSAILSFPRLDTWSHRGSVRRGAPNDRDVEPAGAAGCICHDAETGASEFCVVVRLDGRSHFGRGARRYCRTYERFANGSRAGGFPIGRLSGRGRRSRSSAARRTTNG